MRWQAEFENNRRWLTFDLLCGYVDRHHPFWGYLREHGASEAELLELANDPFPPDILGINYYITSERFLDENHHHFAEHHLRRRQGRTDYADVEAVRVRLVELAGPHDLLLEAWERYHLPIAITEVHLDCTREEQMRWLQYAWDAANKLKEEGVDMRAITVWSLLGAYDWNSLLTQEGAFYESGVFDVRGANLGPRFIQNGTKPRHRQVITIIRYSKSRAGGSASERFIYSSPLSLPLKHRLETMKILDMHDLISPRAQ